MAHIHERSLMSSQAKRSVLLLAQVVQEVAAITMAEQEEPVPSPTKASWWHGLQGDRGAAVRVPRAAMFLAPEVPALPQDREQ